MDLPKILWVDDEKALVEAMQRQLRSDYSITAALSSIEGLAILRKFPQEFAVIVADLRMPVMNGIEFLCEAQKIAPVAVRLMFTGYAALDSAVRAVNEGHVFRFMTKPAEQALIRRFLAEAVRQHELVTAERDLLDNTLSGSLQVLLDVLALASPNAFNRSARIRDTVESILGHINVKDAWALMTAASFIHLGYITLPADTLDKLHHGLALNDEERAMVDKQAQLAVSLLSKIPRLGVVTQILSSQVPAGNSFAVKAREEPGWSAHVLRLAVEFDGLLARGVDPSSAVDSLTDEPNRFDAELVAALRRVPFAGTAAKLKLCRVEEIIDGMVIGENIYTEDGILLVPKGYVVNSTVRHRLHNFHTQRQIGHLVPVLTDI